MGPVSLTKFKKQCDVRVETYPLLRGVERWFVSIRSRRNPCFYLSCLVLLWGHPSTHVQRLSTSLLSSVAINRDFLPVAFSGLGTLRERRKFSAWAPRFMDRDFRETRGARSGRPLVLQSEWIDSRDIKNALNRMNSLRACKLSRSPQPACP